MAPHVVPWAVPSIQEPKNLALWPHYASPSNVARSGSWSVNIGPSRIWDQLSRGETTFSTDSTGIRGDLGKTVSSFA